MPQTVKDDAGELLVCMNVLMGQIGIDYSKLTKEEQMTLLRQDGRTYTIGSSASLRWVGRDRQLQRPSAHLSATEQVLAGTSRSPFSASAGTKV